MGGRVCAQGVVCVRGLGATREGGWLGVRYLCSESDCIQCE